MFYLYIEIYKNTNIAISIEDINEDCFSSIDALAECIAKPNNKYQKQKRSI